MDFNVTMITQRIMESFYVTVVWFARVDRELCFTSRTVQDRQRSRKLLPFSIVVNCHTRIDRCYLHVPIVPKVRGELHPKSQREIPFETSLCANHAALRCHLLDQASVTIVAEAKYNTLRGIVHSVKKQTAEDPYPAVPKKTFKVVFL